MYPVIVAAMGDPIASQSVTLPVELSMKLRYEENRGMTQYS